MIVIYYFRWIWDIKSLWLIIIYGECQYTWSLISQKPFIYMRFTPVNCYPFSDWWSSETMGPVDDGTRRPSTKPHHDIQQREIRVMHANEPFYYVHGHVTWQSITESDTKHYLLLGLLTIDRRIRRRPVALRFQEGNLGCNCARQKHHVTCTRKYAKLPQTHSSACKTPCVLLTML